MAGLLSGRSLAPPSQEMALHLASSLCHTCGWPEADAELVENEEGLVVSVALTCRACSTLVVIVHARGGEG